MFIHYSSEPELQSNWLCAWECTRTHTHMYVCVFTHTHVYVFVFICMLCPCVCRYALVWTCGDQRATSSAFLVHKELFLIVAWCVSCSTGLWAPGTCLSLLCKHESYKCVPTYLCLMSALKKSELKELNSDPQPTEPFLSLKSTPYKLFKDSLLLMTFIIELDFWAFICHPCNLSTSIASPLTASFSQTLFKEIL